MFIVSIVTCKTGVGIVTAIDVYQQEGKGGFLPTQRSVSSVGL